MFLKVLKFAGVVGGPIIEHWLRLLSLPLNHPRLRWCEFGFCSVAVAFWAADLSPVFRMEYEL